MRINNFAVPGLSLLVLMLFAFGAPKEASAGVQLNVNIGPPPIVAPEPREVVPVPDTGVYYVPEPGIDVFFYGGYWWSPRGDRWYRARRYNGPWVVMEPRYVPRQVFVIPRDHPDYRHRYEKERHIPYGQWKKAQRERGDHGGEHGRGHDHENHGHNHDNHGHDHEREHDRGERY